MHQTLGPFATEGSCFKVEIIFNKPECLGVVTDCVRFKFAMLENSARASDAHGVQLCTKWTRLDCTLPHIASNAVDSEWEHQIQNEWEKGPVLNDAASQTLQFCHDGHHTNLLSKFALPAKTAFHISQDNCPIPTNYWIPIFQRIKVTKRLMNSKP